MAILTARGVTKCFANDIKVLDNVDIDIEKGDFLSIIGASGSGKSTLLTILGGIDRPTKGEVILDGVDIAKLSERELAVLRRTKIGFVFQFFNLAPYLNVTENVLLPIILANKPIKEHTKKAEELLDYLGIADQKNKMPSQLSGGEQQRVAIARGLIFNPEVILLDEPTGNLDSKSGTAIMELLSSINKEFNTTIVQVTHSVKNAGYGNRIISIEDGKIVNK